MALRLQGSSKVISRQAQEFSATYWYMAANSFHTLVFIKHIATGFCIILSELGYYPVQVVVQIAQQTMEDGSLRKKRNTKN